MPDAIPVQPPEAKSEFEIFLDRIEKFVSRIDKNKLVKALSILLSMTKIAFRFVPMKADEKELFDDIVGAATDGIAALKGNP